MPVVTYVCMAIQLNMERVCTTQSERAVAKALPAWGCVHYYLEISIPVMGSVLFCFASPLTACRPLCRFCLRLSNQPSVAVSRSTGAMFVVMLVYPHICGNQYFSVPAAAALLYGWRRWPRLPWAGTGTLIQGLYGEVVWSKA